MLKKEIEKEVRQLWRKQRPQQPTGDDMFFFFGKLPKELTLFQSSGDPWQTIHCWLLDEEKKLKNS